MEILNRDKQYVSLFKNHLQIEHSGLITLVGRHYELVYLEENSSLVKSCHWDQGFIDKLLKEQHLLYRHYLGLCLSFLMQKGGKKKCNLTQLAKLFPKKDYVKSFWFSKK